MDGTRRFGTAVGTGGVLVLLGVTFARPVFVVGGAGVWALVVGVQLSFLDRLHDVDRSLSVEQSLDRNYVTKGEEIHWELEATLDRPTPLGVSITPHLPVTLSSRETSAVSLTPGETTTRTSATITASVVGPATIPAPDVNVTDPYGLFEERLETDATAAITVEPRQTRNVHVGAGGEAVVSTPGGSHRTDRIGTGIDAVGIREYVPGDTISNIDWKATARLASPHVREFEVETDRQTVIVFDERGDLATGREGETMLAYLREVALTAVGAATRLDDPLGLYAIGDDGVTAERKPKTDERTYARIRSRLQEATPTGANADRRAVGPGVARARAATLHDEATPFARTLRPFFTDGDRYVERIASEPLFGTIRTRLPRLEGNVWVLLFTDDRNRGELREAVKLARQGGNHVMVFMTPTALFEPDAVTDLEDAYVSYRDFEEFRRQLARLDRVEAYEVAPGDRIEALLSDREARREQ